MMVSLLRKGPHDELFFSRPYAVRRRRAIAAPRQKWLCFGNKSYPDGRLAGTASGRRCVRDLFDYRTVILPANARHCKQFDGIGSTREYPRRAEDGRKPMCGEWNSTRKEEGTECPHAARGCAA